MKNIFLLIAACATFLACNKANDVAISVAHLDRNESDRAVPVLADSAVATPSPQYAQKQQQEFVDKKIIKNGEMRIQAEDVKKARNSLESLLNNCGGYVQEESFNNDEYRENIEMQLRIPNQNFDKFVNSLSSNALGIVRYKNISSSDITEEYYDTAIRLKNKELYLEKYREFLRNAKTTKDMLEVQEKIRNMEEEIESAKGKLRYIDDRVNYSSLSLEIYNEKPQTVGSSEISFFSRFWSSMKTGWNLLEGLVLGVVAIWPLILILILGIWGFCKWRKNRRLKKKTRQ